MRNVIGKLTKRLAEDRKLAATLTRLVQNQPEGKLQVSTIRGHSRYYHVLHGQKQYLGKADTELVKKLAEKEYCAQMLELAQKETRLLERFLRNFDPSGFVKCYGNLIDGRKRMVDPIVLPDEMFRAQWLAKTVSLKESYRNDYEIPEGFITLNGEAVRSKSEKILADLLKHRGLVYVYEAPLMLNDGIIYPDFTILNLRTREVWYWEHFGLMDDPRYAAKTAEKIRRYETSGFFPGEHLIFTMETAQRPLKTEEIETLIERYLL